MHFDKCLGKDGDPKIYGNLKFLHIFSKTLGHSYCKLLFLIIIIFAYSGKKGEQRKNVLLVFKI
jgi:hypothetical protein